MADFDEMPTAPVKKGVYVNFANEFQSEDLNGVEVSPWQIVPAGIQNIQYFLEILTTGEAFVEITYSPADIIRNGTPVSVKWDPGNVTVNTTISSLRINAFRIVMVSGDARLFANAS